MGKVYRDPERPWRDIFIHDADSDLKEPPTPSEGEIVQIDMAHRDVTASGSWIRCQSCGTSVPRDEPHPRVVVNLTSGPFGSYRRAHFCDASCWASWASQEV